MLRRVIIGGHATAANAIRGKLRLSPLSKRSEKHSTMGERGGSNIRAGESVWSDEATKEKFAAKTERKSEKHNEAVVLNASHNSASGNARITPWGEDELPRKRSGRPSARGGPRQPWPSYLAERRKQRAREIQRGVWRSVKIRHRGNKCLDRRGKLRVPFWSTITVEATPQGTKESRRTFGWGRKKRSVQPPHCASCAQHGILTSSLQEHGHQRESSHCAKMATLWGA